MCSRPFLLHRLANMLSPRHSQLPAAVPIYEIQTTSKRPGKKYNLRISTKQEHWQTFKVLEVCAVSNEKHSITTSARPFSPRLITNTTKDCGDIAVHNIHWMLFAVFSVDCASHRCESKRAQVQPDNCPCSGMILLRWRRWQFLVHANENLLLPVRMCAMKGGRKRERGKIMGRKNRINCKYVPWTE